MFPTPPVFRWDARGKIIGDFLSLSTCGKDRILDACAYPLSGFCE